MELQGRQGEFEEQGAVLVALGSVPETMDVAGDTARRLGITYPILYDRETDITRSLGLWSDHMEMPWMGFVIMDKSGRIVAGEQQLDESKGAAPKSVDRILRALDQSRTSTPSASGGLQR